MFSFWAVASATAFLKEKIKMIKNPIYRSLRESFSKDVYMPTCGVVAAPTVVFEVKKSEDIDVLSSVTPPQNVILHVNSDLFVEDSEKRPTVSLAEAVIASKRSVPVFYIDSKDTADALARFTDDNNIADAILCTTLDKMEVLAYAYLKMPLLRGMLDGRGIEYDVDSLPSILVANAATSVILSSEGLTEDTVHSLSQRFIHTVTDDAPGFDTVASIGANGIITNDTDSAYSFLASFPEGENSFLRRRNLFAHKGFQNNGTYSENTITGVVAAAENNFDGAEIDVKLTSDDIAVVMHNTTTKGLFDCEERVTEESDYAFLSSLRRIDFENESIDRFDDLMFRMNEHKDTPVLIEIKPSEKYNGVEKLVSITDEILRDERAQKNCICIMGALTPGLKYVHDHIPYLPLSHCEGGRSIPPAPVDRKEAEDRLYREALITKGCAAGYNCEDTNINRLFNEYAKFRMLTVFPWSRSWTLSPSKWEVNGPMNDKTYIAGYDAWTTDHGEKYLDLPIGVEKTEEKYREGLPFVPRCVLSYRDKSKSESECELHVLSGNVRKTENGYVGYGSARAMLSYRIHLHFGDSYLIYSKPVDIEFKK